jgi:hypothetical protein
MKYMLLMNVPGGGPYQIAGWAAAEITAHIAFMRDFVKRLAAAGELVGAEGLAGPDQAKLVRAGGRSRSGRYPPRAGGGVGLTPVRVR